MTILTRYILRHLFQGFAATAVFLVPLFSTFDFINELDDISAQGYHWTQALLVILMRLPRCLVDLGPFIALLGGIIGLGQLSKSLELTVMRVAGLSVVNIALVALLSGVLFTAGLSLLDEWVASPLQQRAFQIKNTATASPGSLTISGKPLWASSGNLFVTVKAMDEHGRPVGIEIFHYRADFTLQSYIYAATAIVQADGVWLLSNVNEKTWVDGKESARMLPALRWTSIFTHENLQELMMPSDSFSTIQLMHYIDYLRATHQPAEEFELALWQKLGRPVLTLAMILLAVPFTFSHPRATGLGSRLALGAIVGLLTYIIYQIGVNLGLLFSLNAVLTTVFPATFILLTALLLIVRFDRYQR